MRFSLPISLLLHGGLLAWAFIGFSQIKPLRPVEPEPVEVAIITEDGLTRLRQGDRNSKNLETAAVPKPAPPSPAVKETPKAKPPEPKPEPPPPPPPEPAKTEPPPKVEPPQPKAEAPPKPPEPQKDEIAELALKAEAEAKAEAERKAAEEKKRIEDARRAEAKRKRDEMLRKQREEAARRKKLEDDRRKLAEMADKKDSLSDLEQFIKPALKDNDPRKRAQQPAGPQTALAPSNIKGPQAGAPEGRDRELTASQGALLGSLIKRAVQPCFNVDGGADGVKDVIVRVAVQLRPDGQLAVAPRVVDPRPGPLFDAVAAAAMRAVVRCGPYSFPAELYKGGWENSIWRFAPGEMF